MSTQRAFVIQFRQGAGAEGSFTGRVEHVGSGEATHFTTPEELIRFLDRQNGRAVPARSCADAAAASTWVAPRPRRGPS